MRNISRWVGMGLIVLSFVVMSLGALGADSVAPATQPTQPTLYIIGDSTVHNTTKGLSGWGDQIAPLFDTTKIKIENHAMGGRSSRTFIAEGRWDKVLAKLKPGDFVLMQFGHNDGGPINDTSRARGSLKGIGEETEEIDNLITKKHEIVHTFGWYIRKYVTDTKGKGATPIVCALIPRNDWRDGKVIRPTRDGYQQWARQIAEAEKVDFIDLYERCAQKWESLGQEKTTAELFLTEHTHTTAAGAKVSAECVVEGIKELKDCELAKFVK